MSSPYVIRAQAPVFRKAYPVKEKQTGEYSFTLQDETGAPIPASDLTDARLTLHVPTTGTIVNSRDNQSVLNANQVTISEAGLVTWAYRIADMTMVDATLTEETHRALFVFTWQSGLRSHPHEVDFIIENLDKLT